MSRLGDLLLTERMRKKKTRKEVARMCGVSEGYLKDVEEGRRIIQDDQARRMLKILGSVHTGDREFSLDEIAATVDLETLVPQQKKEEPERIQVSSPVAAPKKKDSGEKEMSGIWLDALSTVVRSVPVFNAAMAVIGKKLVPVANGKIEGSNPDKVFFFSAPDDSMKFMRIEKGDTVLIVPQSVPENHAIMLVEYGAHRFLRQLKFLGNNQLLLQSGDRELDVHAVAAGECKILGKAVRNEFRL